MADISSVNPKGPHSHILMTRGGGGGGGGGLRAIFWGLKFCPKVIFLGLWRTPGFLGREKKQRGFLGLRKKD